MERLIKDKWTKRNEYETVHEAKLGSINFDGNNPRGLIDRNHNKSQL